LISAVGVLEFVDRPATLDDVGGLSRLKKWLREREAGLTIEGQAAGLEAPKGVLLLGVQGAGKSLSAKAIATAWQRPLMKLDPGVLYDRYVGESERRLREALRQAEAMAPVVLWIDEIEKGFASAASQSTDGGLSQRMFGTLLSWMQDRAAPVFLVATANNIDALPPELLRKGRFDEIFFVDLPGAEAREQIFKIHLRKRKQKIESFDLRVLVSESDGFSGGEIEQAVVAGVYSAFQEQRGMTTKDVEQSLRGTVPLSVTMRERISSLRTWARERCVMAE
jgi:SpoVK/Ycf46/Vps4 family AAA+-type ATPase